MTPERWQQVKLLFQQACALAPAGRAMFLEQKCEQDSELYREVLSLLVADQHPDHLVDQPVVAVAPTEFIPSEVTGQLGPAPWKIGGYELIREIGRGGMGEVHLAYDTRLGRKLAVKLLPRRFASVPERIRRFQREARAASGLNHPNILTIHNFGEDRGYYYIATEFVEGQTLRSLIKSGELTFARSLDIALQTASALAAAHQAGVVHRDIKPENIMVRSDGVVKVLDFGLAKLTEPDAKAEPVPVPQQDSEWLRDLEMQDDQGGQVSASPAIKTEPGLIIGTVSYMSPEQVRGLPVDARSDIFSLGVVTYEMVTGNNPFQAPSCSDAIAAILVREPPPLSKYLPDVSPEIQRIVSKALVKEREERYQQVKKLLDELRLQARELASQAEVRDEAAGAAGSRDPVNRHVTGGIGRAQITGSLSSAEYILNGIKRHKKWAGAIALGLLLPLLLVLAHSNKSTGLRERDTVLVTDFSNSTGEPVFDETLKQALETQLDQSPFLNIFPEQRVREGLKFLGRSPDDRVTVDLARQICERQGMKALLAGSISNLGGHYVVSVEAINALSGDVIAREQVEAENKERVLTSLGKIASELRKKLGESLASIQKFNAPVEQVTTSSLEALRAFSMGDLRRQSGEFTKAIPFYQHAIELDPNFAMAYARLGAAYASTAESALANEYSRKAFDMRDRVSERERLYISAHYYDVVTGEFDKQHEIYLVWAQTYPDDFVPHTDLSLDYLILARSDKAVEEAREAIRLDPGPAFSYENLALGLEQAGRFDEEKRVIDQCLKTHPDSFRSHLRRCAIAFIEHDSSRLQQEAAWAAGQPPETSFPELISQAAAFDGQLQASSEKYRSAAQLLKNRDPAEAALLSMDDVLTFELLGKHDYALAKVPAGTVIPPDKGPLAVVALALCLTRRPDRARSYIDQLTELYPNDIEITRIWLPVIAAAAALSKGNPVRAVEALESSRSVELGAFAEFWPTYFRALAYLRMRSSAKAAAEFQNILDHRGVSPTSPVYPLAELGLARATAQSGDIATSRRAYETLFEFWKHADPDLPVLQEAKQEYARLK